MSVLLVAELQIFIVLSEKVTQEQALKEGCI